MTDLDAAPDAEMLAAVETLVQRLEREHAWAVELRQDLAHTEREIAKLRAACAPAISMLPRGARLPFLQRAAAVTVKGGKPGRQARDARFETALEFVRARPDQEIRNADVRRALRAEGLGDDPQYVANLLLRWAGKGMLTHVGHGRYRIDGTHPRIEALRLSPPPAEDQSAVRAEIADGRAQADARFDEVVAEREQRRKAEEHENLRRRNFYRPRAEWDPNHKGET